MKYRNCFSTLVIVTTLILAACSGEDYKEDPAFDEEIKTKLVDKSHLPDWLVDYINYLEYDPEGKGLFDEHSGIYRFRWDGKTYYELYSPQQSSIHQELYSEGGARIKLGENDYKSLCENARDWTIVYLFHPTHEKPQYREYPITTKDEEIRQLFLKTDPFKSVGNSQEVSMDLCFETQCFIVNSAQQLAELEINEDSLPSIDFSKYSLIIGLTNVPRETFLTRQELSTEDGDTILRLYYDTERYRNQSLGKLQAARTFWGLYPKLTPKRLALRLYFSNLHLDGYSWNYYSPYRPEYWNKQMQGITPVSKADFDKYVIGNCWHQVNKYKIDDSGTIIPIIHWTTIQGSGGVPAGYDFDKDSLSIYIEPNYAALSYVTYTKHALSYSEESGMINADEWPYFQLLSVSKERMEVIQRKYVKGGKYGQGRDVYYYIILERLTDEELEEMRARYGVK